MIATLALLLTLGCGDVPRAPYELPRTTWRCIGIRSNRGRWLVFT